MHTTPKPADNAAGLNVNKTRELRCYHCQQPGHKATVRTMRKSKMTGFCYVLRDENECTAKVTKPLITLNVTVDGKCLNALLDTGSSISLLKSCWVTNVCYANAIAIQCAHEDVKYYPCAEVTVCVKKTKVTC